MFALVMLAIDAVEEDSERDLLERLFVEYSNYAYTIAFDIFGDKYNSEEAVSQTFLNVINNRSQFVDIEKKKEVNLIRIYTRHVCYNMLNRRKIEDRLFTETEVVLEDGKIIQREFEDDVSIEGDYVGSETVRDIKKLIKSLPYPDNDILWLKLFHSRTSKEIAELYGMNASTVRNVIQRAKAKIADMVERSGLR